ncbi:MAG: 16S rRNA (guanine(527)-N(7))-methyltransferase RsmG [Ruminococcaceae bacterium]|nr:16S rRNA (guanine(527)-N(7))-methyltransferase RsmG [Oscillospiraceae bacterium]
MIEIDKKSFTSTLTRAFAANGMSSLLSLEKNEKFYALTVRMLEENEKYNLTAITEPSKIILNHYVDCATLAAKLKKGATVIDVGCGAGFPTLPLAIVRPDLKITAMDSTAKRVNYVAETAKLLGLDNVTAITMRAEDGGKSPEYREKFDYATARAVAEMRTLAELALPFVKVGGQMVAMKGKNAEFELSAAKKAIATLGGRNTVCDMITLKGDGETLTHPLIIIDKKEKTPTAYPRPFAQISKKPL